MAEVKRTLISEYILDGQRRPAGTEVTLSATAFKKAVAAGVVHEDDALNAEVKRAPPNAPAAAAPNPVDTNKPPAKESPVPQPDKIKT
jgi:hypothetical protein